MLVLAGAVLVDQGAGAWGLAFPLFFFFFIVHPARRLREGEVS
jgi:hypothetical protein